jgi:2-iminobutanoate/2-iminopropanoate deaminase
MEYVSSIPGAPAAIGPYSPAVLSKDFVFLSGQIPLNPDTGKLVDGGIEQQTEQVLRNVDVILSHLGLSFREVVKTTIFLTDLATFSTVNSIYQKVLGEAKPARSTIQVAALPLGAQVEIEMIAQRSSASQIS